ncbi:hypothetical protein GGR58DRAFT_296495 [Xylaria digitata]|nr:hypothetical protein GGR58DRAFT_296495 [Xylaria digitata]
MRLFSTTTVGMLLHRLISLKVSPTFWFRQLHNASFHPMILNPTGTPILSHPFQNPGKQYNEYCSCPKRLLSTKLVVSAIREKYSC